jgi:regulation of enolase protein 1 (concanavalin A-like superfamily)
MLGRETGNRGRGGAWPGRDGEVSRTELQELLGRGVWSTEPVSARLVDDHLVVEAVEGSDAWRTTSYGFVHDTEHALLMPLAGEEAVEVSFRLDYTEQFDQAGVFLSQSATHWIKAGVEVSDGVPQLGAVVTHEFSDWSVAPVPDWHGREVTIRASRSGDAVTIRARTATEPWRLVRVAHLDPGADIRAGIFCAAPTRPRLVVTFTGYRTTVPDASLH